MREDGVVLGEVDQVVRGRRDRVEVDVLVLERVEVDLALAVLPAEAAERVEHGGARRARGLAELGDEGREDALALAGDDVVDLGQPDGLARVERRVVASGDDPCPGKARPDDPAGRARVEHVEREHRETHDVGLLALLDEVVELVLEDLVGVPEDGDVEEDGALAGRGLEAGGDGQEAEALAELLALLELVGDRRLEWTECRAGRGKGFSCVGVPVLSPIQAAGALRRPAHRNAYLVGSCSRHESETP